MALFECNASVGGGGKPIPTEYNQTFTSEGWINVKTMDLTKDRYFVIKVVNNSNEELIYVDKFQYVSSKNSVIASNVYSNGNYQINIRIFSNYLGIGIVGVPTGGYKIYFKEYDMASLIE